MIRIRDRIRIRDKIRITDRVQSHRQNTESQNHTSCIQNHCSSCIIGSETGSETWSETQSETQSGQRHNQNHTQYRITAAAYRITDRIHNHRQNRIRIGSEAGSER